MAADGLKIPSKLWLQMSQGTIQMLAESGLKNPTQIMQLSGLDQSFGLNGL